MKLTAGILCFLFSMNLMAQVRVPPEKRDDNPPVKTLAELDAGLSTALAKNISACNLSAKGFQNTVDFYIQTKMIKSLGRAACSDEVYCLFTTKNDDAKKELAGIIASGEKAYKTYLRETYKLSEKETQPIWTYYVQIYKELNPRHGPNSEQQGE